MLRKRSGQLAPLYDQLKRISRSKKDVIQASFCLQWDIANTTTQGFIYIDNAQFITHPNALLNNPA